MYKLLKLLFAPKYPDFHIVSYENAKNIVIEAYKEKGLPIPSTIENNEPNALVVMVMDYGITKDKIKEYIGSIR